MKFLRRFFSPANSLILTFDHLAHESMDAFDARIDEVGRYYRFVKLSEIVGALKSEAPLGTAAVVFLNARKSAVLRALPRLKGLGIPFTFFLRVDCIGLNRLPPEEELEIFRDHYGDKIPAETAQAMLADQWENPQKLDDYLGTLRREVGPFPIEPLDPTRFFSTWGKILENPTELLDLGVVIASDPNRSSELSQWLTFIHQRSGQRISLAYCARPIDVTGPTSPNARWINELGIEAVVTNCDGPVDRNTSRYALPQWKG